MADLPVVNTTPTNGELHYSEGRFIGYRAWRQADRTPLIPFGYGLSYTTFVSELLSSNKSNATVKVTNTGDRAGAHVVQLYAASDSTEGFERRLVGFTKVTLAAGESASVDVVLEPLVFKIFNNGWKDAPGNWSITLAESAFAAGQSLLV